MTVIGTDGSPLGKLEVTVGANVVVTFLALRAMKASGGWWNRISAYVAFGAEVKRGIGIMR